MGIYQYGISFAEETSYDDEKSYTPQFCGFCVRQHLPLLNDIAYLKLFVDFM